VEDTEKLSLEQIRAFLPAGQEVRFEATLWREMYEWMTRALCYQEYWKQKRAIKGLLWQIHRNDDGVEPGPGDAHHVRRVHALRAAAYRSDAALHGESGFGSGPG